MVLSLPHADTLSSLAAVLVRVDSSVDVSRQVASWSWVVRRPPRLDGHARSCPFFPLPAPPRG